MQEKCMHTCWRLRRLASAVTAALPRLEQSMNYGWPWLHRVLWTYGPVTLCTVLAPV